MPRPFVGRNALATTVREMPLSLEQVAWCRANAATVRGEVERLEAKERAENSLIEFVRQYWRVIHPGMPFIRGWAMDAICEHLEAISRGELLKVLINVPPGFSKSLQSNVYFPSWEWGPRNRPGLQYISWSYTQELTIRDNRRGRYVIEDDEYQRNWGDRFKLVGDQNAKARYDNNKRGFRLATSVGGQGTGERGHRLIIDDPHPVRDADSDANRLSALTWFAETLPSRTKEPEPTAFLVIMQRIHEQDVSGLILEKELGYEHLCIPMEFESDRRCSTSIGWTDPRTEEGELAFPELFDGKKVEALKKSLRAMGGTYAEAGQLQQRPAPRGGGMFQRKDFQILDILREADKTGQAVRHWDLAASTGKTADYTVGLKLRMTGDGRLIVEDMIRGRWSPWERDQQILAAAKQDGHAVRVSLPIDPGAAGKDVQRHLAKLLHGFTTVFARETGDKAARAAPVAAQAEAGNLWLVRAEWNDALIQEATVFPAGRHDDCIDGLSGAYGRLLRGERGQRTGLPGYAEAV